MPTSSSDPSSRHDTSSRLQTPPDGLPQPASTNDHTIDPLRANLNDHREHQTRTISDLIQGDDDGSTTTRRRRVKRRHIAQLTWTLIDAVTMALAAYWTMWLLRIEPAGITPTLIALMIGTRLLGFIRLGMYRAVLRYSGIHVQFCTALGVGLGTAVAAAICQFTAGNCGLTPAFWVLEGLTAYTIAGGLRLGGRLILERHGRTAAARTLIWGAGSLGELALRDLCRSGRFRPVAFMDDDSNRRHLVIHGRRVHGSLDDFESICQRVQPEVVVIAISEAPPDRTRRLFRKCMKQGIRVMLAKGLGTALDDAAPAKLGLRDLALEDLLRRPSRHLDPGPIIKLLRGKRVLITGAGGSIGSELSRQVAAMGAMQVDLLDHSEFNLYQIHDELGDRYPHLPMTPYLVSITNREAVFDAMRQAAPDIVIHAAAYKHVPLVESNPYPAIHNNVQGFRNVLDAAESYQIERLVLISSDKAVRPTNVMGASKRICELMMQSRSTSAITLCAVRFGNVLGSSGSVVPRFLRQIAEGGPVTVTHPDITRYFMLIPEAVGLVLQAAARSTPDESEIFILDMGEPVKIADLAKQLIFMHGHQPDIDIQVKYTGLRPGEKLYEELLTGESDHHTDITDITVAKSLNVNQTKFDHRCNSLLEACSRHELEGVALAIKALVPEWTPSAKYHSAL